MTPLRRPMRARDITEQHRVSTPLELLFDLTFVAAVSLVVNELARAFENGHIERAIGPFFMTFFSIWWAWNQFTWLASAYDTDDVLYRVLTLVQMGGVLVLAAGVPAAFEHGDWVTVTIGYAIMRVGLLFQISRAWHDDGETGRIAGRYVIGIAAVQALWLLRLLVPAGPWLTVTFVLLALCEVTVPLWADRAGDGVRWHPHHVADRVGGFVIIMLGESVLAVTLAVRDSLTATTLGLPLVVVAVSGLIILFALWWIYFAEPAGEGLERHRRRSFLWAYGHYPLLACLAGVGAGLEVAVVAVTSSIKAGPIVAAGALAWPLALWLVLLWAVHAPVVRRASIHPAATWAAALCIAAVPFAAEAIGTQWACALIALLTVGLLAVMIAGEAGRSRRTAGMPG